MQKTGVFQISQEERKAAIDSLIEQSTPKFDFFLLLILSIFIVVPGLFMNNPAVIIGGMVVAPMMSPILSLALGMSITDFRLMRRSLQTLFYALVLTMFTSMVMSFFYHTVDAGTEILTRTYPSLSDLLIAIASGIAASFALVRPNLSATLPGIAISVSLLPAIAVTGIGFAFGDLQLITGSITLFAINLLGIIFSAIIIFNLFGFFQARRESEKKLKEEAETIKKAIPPKA